MSALQQVIVTVELTDRKEKLGWSMFMMMRTLYRTLSKQWRGRKQVDSHKVQYAYASIGTHEPMKQDEMNMLSPFLKRTAVIEVR